MPITKVNIEEFLMLAKQYPILDVRSPGEFAHAHIPEAFILPLFNDEERKIVGTAYKQQSRQVAIKIGLDFFGVKMRNMVEETETIVKTLQPGEGNNAYNSSETTKCVLVHCWRGGMRSSAVAWLLDLYGFKVFLLVGGYKAYRKWALTQFEKKYNFNIIGGYTGSGKTLLLKELEKLHKKIIDLEELACHKGSAFGSTGIPQPGQEMFENLLALKLYSLSGTNIQNEINTQLTLNNDSIIYLEDESQRIGNLQIPISLWKSIRMSPVYFFEIPFKERLNFILEDYGKQDKLKLKESILRIQKRLGGLETKNAIQYLEAGDYNNCFEILLTYYDKWYYKALQNRQNLHQILNKIPCGGVDTKTNLKKLLACYIVNA